MASDLGFIEHSKQTILSFFRDSVNELSNQEREELSVEYYEEMETLHDLTFPNTYYSGQEILSRLNNHRKVFIRTSHTGLVGYIYAEADPEFGEGSIEFFAVKGSEQGKGLGVQLLKVALSWLFTFEKIKSISLCVDSNIDKAIGLYKKVGFNEIHELYFLKKDMNQN